MFSRLKITHKLGLAALFFIVPVLYLLYALVSLQNSAIDFALKEGAGTQYLRDVQAVHFSVAGDELGVAPAETDLAAKIAAVEARLGDGMLATDQSAEAQRLLAGSDKPAARAALRTLISRVGDKSNLILDPDLDSYYEMDLVVVKIPDLLDRMTDLALASRRSFADGDLSTDERLDLLVRMGGLGSVIDGTQASINAAYDGSTDGSVRRALDESFKAYVAAVAHVAENWVKYAPSEQEVAAAHKALAAFYGVTSTDLERLLNARIAKFRHEQYFELGLEGLMFVLAVGLVLGITTRSVIRPLKQVTRVMGQLADGHLDVDINLGHRRDEVGEMAMALQIFQQSLIENKRLEAEEARKSRREAQRAETLSRLFAEFETTIHGITGAVSNSSGEMRHFAESLHMTAAQANRQAENVAVASEQAAANVSTVAAATEELSASIQEITRQVTESSTTARSAVDEAHNTNRTVSAMAEAAARIDEIVRLISEIAAQTNLLALNATIEAARAGEAGKGFAVVASEVKNLAGQTAKATEDITAQIHAMQQVSSEAVRAIGGISHTIDRINGISSAIAAAVEEQGAATAEISRNVQEAATGTKEVSQSIGTVSASASETTQVATQVLDAATALSGEAHRLQKEVTAFIERIRAA